MPFVTECASALSPESQGVLVRAEANQSSIRSTENEGQEGEGAACRREGRRVVSVGGGHVTFSPQPSSEVSVFQDCQLSWGTGGGARLSLSPGTGEGVALCLAWGFSIWISECVPMCHRV